MRRTVAAGLVGLAFLGIPSTAAAGQFLQATFNSPTNQQHFQLSNGTVDIPFEVEADNSFCADSGETLDVTLVDSASSTIDSEQFTFTGPRGSHTFTGALTATHPGDHSLIAQ